MDQLPPPSPSISRPPPVVASSLEIAGVRYQQDQSGALPEKESAAVYLAANDALTGERLWGLKIETATKPTPGAPFAFNFVYLTSISLGSKATELIVVSSSNTRYTVDLQKRAIVAKQQSGITPILATVPLVVPDIVLPSGAQYGKLPDALDHQGVHYRQGRDADDLPIRAHSSFLIAIDHASGKMLWHVKVGEKPPTEEPNKWTAAMMTFASMTLDAAANELMVVDFAGRHYRINLRTRSVDLLTSEHESSLLAPLGPMPPMPGS